MMVAATNDGLTPVPVGSGEYAELLEWMYREARLLDTGDFISWLALMANDIVYEMPTRSSVMPKDGAGFHLDFGFFAESHSSLTARVKRLQTDQAWAEQPRSRTRHFISNVLADRAADGTFVTTSSFLLTRLRSNRPYDVFTGERRDVLRRQDGVLKLARRTIFIDQTVLESHNLSMFF
jgi:ethylbenzene dioxygenase subunit beta